jgi:hypothetical protein
MNQQLINYFVTCKHFSTQIAPLGLPQFAPPSVKIVQEIYCKKITIFYDSYFDFII